MVQTNNESGITRALGNFARDLEYEDLSPEVIAWAKYLCLDFAAVTLNGSTTDSARAAVDALQRLGPPPGHRQSWARPIVCCRNTLPWPMASPSTP